MRDDLDKLMLIARLEAATGPDRELDLAISVAVNHRDEFDRAVEWRWSDYADEIEGYREGKRVAILDPVQFVPLWTSSLDATISMVERLQPGWWWEISSTSAATICSADHETYVVAGGRTPPLALLIALLKALPHDD